MDADAEPAWPVGPPRPALADGAVHVWRADLDADPPLGGSLSEEERARAARLAGARHRHRWTRSREVLRALLARYLDLAPAELRFSLGAHGKPSLDPPALFFSLSHSGAIALYAVTATGEVGVDVELRRETGNAMAIAARVFSPDEAARLQTLEERERPRAFLRAWVRHEAELKRRGVGLLRSEVPGARAGDSWISHLDVGQEAAAALSLKRAPGKLCCWRWPPA